MPHLGRQLRQVVLISGDRESRIGFTRIARRWENVRLVVAEGATAGVRAVVSERPQLVVLDAQLPDTNALSTVSTLRKTSVARRVPMVVIGTDGTGHEELRFLQVGADSYLTRPLDIEKVDQTALGWLEVGALRP